MRLTQGEYFMSMAFLVSIRSTCLHRQVGAVLVNENKHVIATGYNGPPRGMNHCTSCKRTKPGEDLGSCHAVHAEQNALLQMGNSDRKFQCYVTHYPCEICMRMLLNTGCTEIHYCIPYPNNTASRIIPIKHEIPSIFKEDVIGLS